MTVFLMLEKLRQEAGHKFKSNLIYTLNSRKVRAV